MWDRGLTVNPEQLMQCALQIYRYVYFAIGKRPVIDSVGRGFYTPANSYCSVDSLFATSRMMKMHDKMFSTDSTSTCYKEIHLFFTYKMLFKIQSSSPTDAQKLQQNTKHVNEKVMKY